MLYLSKFAIIDKYTLRLAMVRKLVFLVVLATLACGCTGIKNARKKALDENIQATVYQLNVIKTI